MTQTHANFEDLRILYSKPNRPITVETKEGHKVLYLFSSDDAAEEVRLSLLTLGVEAEIFRPESNAAWLSLLTAMAERDVGWVAIDPIDEDRLKLTLIDAAIVYFQKRVG